MAEFHLIDHVSVQPGEDGVSIVTAKIPSNILLDVLQLCELLVVSSRWLRMRCRSSEAIYKVRESRDMGILK